MKTVSLGALLSRKGRKRLGRYRQIVRILVKHGFGEMVRKSGVRFPRKPHQGKGSEQYSPWERVRMVMEELGPTFVKFGQVLSNRPDLIPRELQEELSNLQSGAASFPPEEAVRIVEGELGSGIDSLFEEFDREPFAAASIAQLHRAVLPGGGEAAVKVQRPGLQEIVEIDVAILKDIAALVEDRYPEAELLKPRQLAREFENAMLQETDFRREAHAMIRFARQFEGDGRIKIPEVYRRLSSRRVLTMEMIRGRPLSDFMNLLPGAESPEEGDAGARIAAAGADLTLRQIFTHGFFHADPHPGNIFVLEDGRLCYLDFGLTGTLIQRDLETISSVLMSIIEQNEQKAARGVVSLAGCRDYSIARSIERDISELIDRFQSSRAGDFSFSGLLAELIDILVQRGLELPTDLFLLVKALMTIEGVATALDPEFDFGKQVEPFAQELVRNRLDPERIKKTLSTAAGDYSQILQSLPGDYYRVVDTLASGRFRFSLQDETVGAFRNTVMQASTELVFAMVLSALLIGSALMVHSRVPPLWHGIPVIGIVGFLAAGLLGFGLLLKIIRTGGLRRRG